LFLFIEETPFYETEMWTIYYPFLVVKSPTRVKAEIKMNLHDAFSSFHISAIIKSPLKRIGYIVNAGVVSDQMQKIKESQYC
jgi:hypothetical protein